MHFEMPLAELIVDYFDQLKSRSQGYASMDYEELGYRAANGGQGGHPGRWRAGGSLSLMSRPRSRRRRRPPAAHPSGWKQLIPRQMFEIPIQAAVGVEP